MKIFNLIQLKNTGPICQNCAYFQNNPELIEEAYPGLTVMSSGFASVRDQDGICNYNQLYLSARDSCTNFKLCRSEEDLREVRKSNGHPN
jgi:hypothetical protein